MSTNSKLQDTRSSKSKQAKSSPSQSTTKSSSPSKEEDTTASNREIIMDALDSYRSQKKSANGHLMIACPFHNEKEPSLGVVVSNELTVPIGTFHCFGCGEKGHWNKLAEKIGAAYIKDWQRDPEIVGAPTTTDDEELLGSDTNTLRSLLRRERLEEAQPWPASLDWREYGGALLQDVGCLIYSDDRNEGVGLLMPVYVHRKLRGAVKANYTKQKGQSSYYTTAGSWVKKWGMFPYDYAVALKRKTRAPFIFVVEGPRDALRLLRAGIPAVAILGSQNFTQNKALVLGSVADIVYLLTDNDSGGDELYEIAHKILDASKIENKRMRLPERYDKKGNLIKEDPHSMDVKILNRILKLLKTRHDFSPVPYTSKSKTK